MKNETGIEARAEVDILAVQAAQTEAAIRNAAIRQAERQAKMDAWQDPEAMKLRHAVAIQDSIRSLWALREAGQSIAQPPVPPDHELPKELRGQAPSYVRTMLRGNPEWEKKVKAEIAFQEEAHKLRGKHPELWGISFSKVRQENPVELGKEHKVRTGKTLHITAIEAPAPKPEVKKPGLVGRIFAGLKS